MKRIISKKTAYFSIIALLLACLFMSGCNNCAMMASLNNGEDMDVVLEALGNDVFGEHYQTVLEIRIALPKSAHYEAVTEKTGYACLTNDKQREAYKAMEKAIFRFTNEGGGEKGECQLERAYIPNLTSAEIYMVKEAVYYDHPEAFWLSRNYSLDYNFKEGHFIILYSHYSYDDAMTMARAMENAVSAYLLDMPRNLGEYEREKYIHDRLVSECEYDTEMLQHNGDDPDASSAYGALVNHRAICGGYTMATKLLLDRVGIQSHAVHGTADELPHVWLLANIEGSWYHLDTTWDDPVLSEPSANIQHAYFNLTDEMIKADHSISSGFESLTDELISSGEAGESFYNFSLPKAVSTQYNYFEKEAFYIATLSDASTDALSKEIAEKLSRGEAVINIRFDISLDAQAANKWLIKETNALRTAVEKANKEVKAKIKEYIITSYMDHSAENMRRVYIVKLVTKDK